VALVVAEDQIELVNRRSGEVIDSRSVDDLSEVHIIGSNSAGDHITIDLRQADTTVVDNVVIHGGQELRNSITVLSSPESDNVVVDGNQLTVNGTTIDYFGIGLIQWLSGPSEDNIEVISEGEARFVVEDGRPRPDRPDRPRPDRGGPQPTEAIAESDRQRRERSDSPRQLQPGELDAADAIFAQLGDSLTDPFGGPPPRI
jgi:hypothetical protein